MIGVKLRQQYRVSVSNSSNGDWAGRNKPKGPTAAQRWRKNLRPGGGKLIGEVGLGTVQDGATAGEMVGLSAAFTNNGDELLGKMNFGSFSGNLLWPPGRTRQPIASARLETLYP